MALKLNLLSKCEKGYGTWYSQAVTHPSTNQARCCLTSVIRREPVYSTWYGRSHQIDLKEAIYRAQTGSSLSHLKDVSEIHRK